MTPDLRDPNKDETTTAYAALKILCLGGGNSNIFYFHPCLGKIPILTHIFQMGWFNHQLVNYVGFQLPTHQLLGAGCQSNQLSWTTRKNAKANATVTPPKAVEGSRTRPWWIWSVVGGQSSASCFFLGWLVSKGKVESKFSQHFVFQVEWFTFFISQWLTVGLGPGGLDSWDPRLKGIVSEGHPIRIPNHRAPNQQLSISWGWGGRGMMMDDDDFLAKW